MALEAGNYIYNLVQANPPAGDQRKEGDDHLRLIKKVIQQTFPHVTGPNLPTSTGTAATQVVTHIFGPASYIQGMVVAWIAGFTSTGPMTVAVNGLGPKNLFMAGAPIAAGNITLGSLVVAIYDGVQFQIFASTGVGGYLPITGGTLTGNLIVNSNVNLNGAAGAGKQLNYLTNGVLRMQLNLTGTAESGGNAGSDFVINCIADGGGFLNQALAITRATGNAAFGGTVSATQLLISNPVSGGSVINISGAASGSRVLSFSTGANARWLMQATAVAETGANAGSNFSFNAYDDAGNNLGNAFTVVRATRVVTFGVAIVNGPSDRSLKENIEPLENSLDKVLALRGVSFNFIKDKKKRHIGLIAQDVAPIVPEVLQDFIQPDEEPKLAIDYTRLVPMLIEAIKELTARVATLEEKLNAQGNQS